MKVTALLAVNCMSHLLGTEAVTMFLTCVVLMNLLSQTASESSDTVHECRARRDLINIRVQ